MTKFTLSVDMNNAAFVDDGVGGRDELGRILAGLAQRVADTDGGNVLDINGNTVGEWRIGADQ